MSVGVRDTVTHSCGRGIVLGAILVILIGHNRVDGIKNHGCHVEPLLPNEESFTGALVSPVEYCLVTS